MLYVQIVVLSPSNAVISRVKFIAEFSFGSILKLLPIKVTHVGVFPLSDVNY
jgi:hypothetical protein